MSVELFLRPPERGLVGSKAGTLGLQIVKPNEENAKGSSTIQSSSPVEQALRRSKDASMDFRLRAKLFSPGEHSEQKEFFDWENMTKLPWRKKGSEFPVEWEISQRHCPVLQVAIKSRTASNIDLPGIPEDGKAWMTWQIGSLMFAPGQLVDWWVPLVIRDSEEFVENDENSDPNSQVKQTRKKFQKMIKLGDNATCVSEFLDFGDWQGKIVAFVRLQVGFFPHHVQLQESPRNSAPSILAKMKAQGARLRVNVVNVTELNLSQLLPRQWSIRDRCSCYIRMRWLQHSNQYAQKPVAFLGGHKDNVLDTVSLFTASLEASIKKPKVTWNENFFLKQPAAPATTKNKSNPILLVELIGVQAIHAEETTKHEHTVLGHTLLPIFGNIIAEGHVIDTYFPMHPGQYTPSTSLASEPGALDRCGLIRMLLEFRPGKEKQTVFAGTQRTDFNERTPIVNVATSSASCAVEDSLQVSILGAENFVRAFAFEPLQSRRLYLDCVIERKSDGKDLTNIVRTKAWDIDYEALPSNDGSISILEEPVWEQSLTFPLAPLLRSDTDRKTIKPGLRLRCTIYDDDSLVSEASRAVGDFFIKLPQLEYQTGSTTWVKVNSFVSEDTDNLPKSLLPSLQVGIHSGKLSNKMEAVREEASDALAMCKIQKNEVRCNVCIQKITFSSPTPELIEKLGEMSILARLGTLGDIESDRPDPIVMESSEEDASTPVDIVWNDWRCLSFDRDAKKKVDIQILNGNDDDKELGVLASVDLSSVQNLTIPVVVDGIEGSLYLSSFLVGWNVGIVNMKFGNLTRMSTEVSDNVGAVQYRIKARWVLKSGYVVPDDVENDSTTIEAFPVSAVSSAMNANMGSEVKEVLQLPFDNSERVGLDHACLQVTAIELRNNTGGKVLGTKRFSLSEIFQGTKTNMLTGNLQFSADIKFMPNPAWRKSLRSGPINQEQEINVKNANNLASDEAQSMEDQDSPEEIDLPSLLVAMEKSSEMKKLFYRLDEDSSGQLSLAEFLRAMKRKKNRELFEAAVQGETLPLDERLRQPILEKYFVEMNDQADVAIIDGQDHVSWKEFERYLEQKITLNMQVAHEEAEASSGDEDEDDNNNGDSEDENDGGELRPVVGTEAILRDTIRRLKIESFVQRQKLSKLEKKLSRKAKNSTSMSLGVTGAAIEAKEVIREGVERENILKSKVRDLKNQVSHLNTSLSRQTDLSNREIKRLKQELKSGGQFLRQQRHNGAGSSFDDQVLEKELELLKANSASVVTPQQLAQVKIDVTKLAGKLKTFKHRAENYKHQIATLEGKLKISRDNNQLNILLQAEKNGKNVLKEKLSQTKDEKRKLQKKLKAALKTIADLQRRNNNLKKSGTHHMTAAADDDEDQDEDPFSACGLEGGDETFLGGFDGDEGDDDEDKTAESEEVLRLREELAKRNAELEVQRMIKSAGVSAATMSENTATSAEITDMRRRSQVAMNSAITLGNDSAVQGDYLAIQEAQEMRKKERQAQANAGSKIGAAFRGRKERRKFKARQHKRNEAASQIQSRFRGRKERTNFRERKSSMHGGKYRRICKYTVALCLRRFLSTHMMDN
eukprot:g4236.t1